MLNYKVYREDSIDNLLDEVIVCNWRYEIYLNYLDFR